MAKITIVIEDLEDGTGCNVSYRREPDTQSITKLETAADYAACAAIGLLYSESDDYLKQEKADLAEEDLQLELPLYGD